MSERANSAECQWISLQHPIPVLQTGIVPRSDSNFVVRPLVFLARGILAFKLEPASYFQWGLRVANVLLHRFALPKFVRNGLVCYTYMYSMYRNAERVTSTDASRAGIRASDSFCVSMH